MPFHVYAASVLTAVVALDAAAVVADAAADFQILFDFAQLLLVF